VQDMNPEARRIIDLARQARTPTAKDRQRVRAAIGMSLAAATVAAPTGVAAATVKAGGLMALVSSVRVGLSAILIASVSVGGGAYYWRTRSHDAPRPAEVQASAPVPMADRPRAPTPVAAAPEPETPAAGPAGRPPAEARSAVVAQDPLLAEVTLLRRAQRAWQGGKPAVALELAQRHAQAYPHSQLALERGAVEVFALCALGRSVEARALASDLLAKAPTSPLRTSLEESCAGGSPR
jgi:hypothetical protein